MSAFLSLKERESRGTLQYFDTMFDKAGEVHLLFRLRRVLRGIGWLYPDLGYCQGVGVIAAVFLLLLEEEDAFWLLCAIVEDLLPASYYTPSLIGLFILFWLYVSLKRYNVNIFRCSSRSTSVTSVTCKFFAFS